MQTLKINIAIVGATGTLGEILLELLAESDVPIHELYLLASKRSQDKTLRFRNKSYAVTDVADFDFSRVTYALFSAGSAISKIYAPKAVAHGVTVIDNTSHFRYQADVPLIIPEINGQLLDTWAGPGIISNPNCSTIQMLVALNPIYQAVGIQRIEVATYQSVSGAGRAAIAELAQQTSELLNGRPATVQHLPKQIAFNVLPQVDILEDNGFTREEMKMVWETQKIWADPDIEVNPTAVRVPVFYGHSEAIHIQTRGRLSLIEVRKLLQKAPGVSFKNSVSSQFPTPNDCVGTDAVLVGRLRMDLTDPHRINLWVVADNTRKGGALNAVQIMQGLVNRLI